MKTNKITILHLLFLLFSFAVPVSAQQYIEGTVYELDNGKKTPLPGVNVYWKIVNEGVVTDAHGHYKIPIHESIHCLVFSCISYENDTV
ncbi:MAG: carboxypeptidase-like regulatory domain-containing protein, partial [Bacteroidales bacterium]|nr:carboxypeptidase-like regulatory domain-containing protein [Bacteroidales bacterium]